MAANQQQISARRETSRRWSAVVVAALLAAALAGCNSDGAAPATTTSSTAATTSTVPPEHAEVLARYRAFWEDAFLVAADPMDPEHPALAEHAANPELEQLQRAFLSRRASGEVIRGTFELSPTIVSVDGDTATVRDCYLDNTGVYDAGTGERKDEPSNGARVEILVSLINDGGAWKVSEIKKEGEGCQPE